jgi:selenocysteine insertion sequence-binding protein 2
MVVGGQKLCTKILYSMELEVCDGEFIDANNPSSAAPSEENERQWRRALHKAIVVNQTPSSSGDNSSLHKDGDDNVGLQPSLESMIVFHNILSSDDYEDEDALEESIEDITSIAGQYGHVVNARGDDTGNVYVVFGTSDIAAFAAQKLDGMLLGGIKISVSVGSSNTTNRTQQAGSSTVVLNNVLSEDDFEDEDCLNESIGDIRTLAEKYGVVGDVVVGNTSSEKEKGKVQVEYTGGVAVAEEATKQLSGMMFGGRFISATLLSTGTADSKNKDTNSAANPLKDDTKAEQEPPQPMFSGDKIVPERFAQCKRVPKVANSGMPRAYATKIADSSAVPLLTEMLGELMRLQQRSKDQKNARSRRRLVMGLREVARGIRAHKVKMVVMANNLDEYGAIDSKLQEILDLAHAEDVPVIFELNKRKIGKAVGKSIKVSVVGIQNVSGAEQQFKQLKRMAGVA